MKESCFVWGVNDHIRMENVGIKSVDLEIAQLGIQSSFADFYLCDLDQVRSF